MEPSSPLSDNEIIENYRSGDEKSLDLLVHRYTQEIYTFVYRLTGGKDAEDIVSSIFIKIWKNLSTFDSSKNFRAWMYTISRNTVFDWLRKNHPITFSEMDTRKSGADSPEDFSLKLEDTSPLPDKIFSDTENAKILEAAVKKLPLNQRLVITLRDFQGLSFEEITTVMKISENTARSHYRRGIISLRDKLQNTALKNDFDSYK